MEAVKKKFKEGWNTKTGPFNESSSNGYRSYIDPKGKLKVVVGDKGLSTKNIRMALAEKISKSFSTVDLHDFIVPKEKNKATPKRIVVRSSIEESHIAYHTRSKVPKLDDCIVLQKISSALNKKPKRKHKASTSLTSPAGVIGRKCSTAKKLKKNVVIEFTKKAESRPRLPNDVSSDLHLSVDNLHHVTVQNLKCELRNLSTRAEKSGDGFRYGFLKWAAFLKSNHIRFGSTLLFTYVKSSKQLMLKKVIQKIIKKRGMH